MLVKNVKGTSEKSCSCGTWIDHFKKHSGGRGTICYVTTCNDTDVVGAHVVKADGSDSTQYIVPLCQKHNKDTGVMDVALTSLDVRASELPGCGR